MRAVVFIFFFFTSVCFSQTDLTDTIVKAYKIKTKTQHVFFGINSDPTTTYVFTYNKTGRAETCVQTNYSTKAIEAKQYFYYNKKKQLIKELKVTYSGKDSSVQRLDYEYDSKGKQVEWDDNEDKPIVKLKYDKSGRVTEKLSIYKKYQNKVTYQYELSGRPIKETWYVNDVISAIEEKNYNFKGLLYEKALTTYLDGKTIDSQVKEHYEYNEKDLLVKIWSNSQSIERQTFVFYYTFE